MIKLLACIFMLIDHVAILFFPEQIALRFVGRLSMPLYAYCLARGIRYTHDLKKYFLRVLTVAAVSQIPYMLLVNKIKLNICFLWAGAITLIWVCKNVEAILTRFFLIVGIILASAIIPVDYGLYGLVYVVILYRFAFQTNDVKMYVAWFLLHILKFIMDPAGAIIQLFTLPTLAIIDICNRYKFEMPRKNNKLITWFYPVHISVLLILYIFLE